MNTFYPLVTLGFLAIGVVMVLILRDTKTKERTNNALKSKEARLLTAIDDITKENEDLKKMNLSLSKTNSEHHEKNVECLQLTSELSESNEWLRGKTVELEKKVKNLTAKLKRQTDKKV